MRVLLVSDFYPPVMGGLEAHVQRLGRQLAARGNTVSVVAASDRFAAHHDGEVYVTLVVPSIARIPGVHQQSGRAFPPPWPDRRIVAAVTAEAQRVQAEVIHAHGWIAASAEVAADQLSLPLVVTLHDWGLLCPTRTLLRDGRSCHHHAGLSCLRCPGANQATLKRVGLGLAIAGQARRPRRTPTYIAVSRSVADRHIDAGFPVQAVIPNFLDLPVEDVSPLPDSPTVVFIGPDGEHKGLRVVEEAHRLLLDRGIDVELVHAGGSRAEARRDRVTRLGVLPPEDLSQVYPQATVVAIAPTWEEPCPTVALEAMAAGRAIVAAAIGGLTDIVDPGVSGLLVPPRSAVALADGLADLLSSPGTAQRMGMAGRARLERFSSPVVVSRIEELYADVGPVTASHASSRVAI